MARKKVQWHCPECGYIKVKKITFWHYLWRFGELVLIAFISINFFLGIMASYNFVAGGIYENPDLMFSIGGFWATTHNIASEFQSYEYKEELKNISINLTKGCGDDYCKAQRIFIELINFKFKNGTDLRPLTIWDEKECDCDECSYLFISLLKSIDINSMMQCTQNHCYTIVKLEDKRILADVVQYKWREL